MTGSMTPIANIALIAIVRLFQTRRSADSTQKQRILEAANAVADVIQQHLHERDCGKQCRGFLNRYMLTS